MTKLSGKFRLITRSDFDGLVSAVLLRELGLIDEIKFVHPKDMQDGIIEVTDMDITTNLPFVEGVHIAFDHHLSETIRVKGKKLNYIIEAGAPSASRVVYDYYGGKKRFKNISDELMTAVDKTDAAWFTEEDVLHPKGWVLLSFLLDARTGLGRFSEFRISNYTLMMNLIDYCKDHGIEEILKLYDVVERVQMFNEHEEKFKEQIKRCSVVYGNIVILDLRNENIIYASNRFVIYVIFPQCNISIHCLWGVKKQNTVFTIGKSIFNKSSKVNIGALMLEYLGGGHENAGTCQIQNEKSEDILKEITGKLLDN